MERQFLILVTRGFFIGELNMNNSIFDRLPDNLHLARNKSAPDFDRWRIYNHANDQYIKDSGAKTIEECMLKHLAYEQKQRDEWNKRK